MQATIRNAHNILQSERLRDSMQAATNRAAGVTATGEPLPPRQPRRGGISRAGVAGRGRAGISRAGARGQRGQPAQQQIAPVVGNTHDFLIDIDPETGEERITRFNDGGTLGPSASRANQEETRVARVNARQALDEARRVSARTRALVREIQALRGLGDRQANPARLQRIVDGVQELSLTNLGTFMRLAGSTLPTGVESELSRQLSFANTLVGGGQELTAVTDQLVRLQQGLMSIANRITREAENTLDTATGIPSLSPQQRAARQQAAAPLPAAAGDDSPRVSNFLSGLTD